MDNLSNEAIAAIIVLIGFALAMVYDLLKQEKENNDK